MTDQPFTNREIRLMFEKIELHLTEIKGDIAQTNTNFERRVTRLETDVEDLKTFQTRAMVVWAVIVVMVGWVVNNFAKFL